ncbi:hypothetical protein UFOVP1325_37 [uncultured Caudovirales phage]|uniref:Large polyvalent protein associated domain-containing protein n=1 Tax=uncultured Caudovirales phage TaxID=2100421 RepID=A0A6J5SEX1_9CAUD|nr:hypothetical protein UFOVP1325_37 [uncultured Caudovirales phage]CAB4212792.1 hypothetical protein UFOVP1435_34 [uncultured Caudovirales phage]CAB5227966.1 hypothetical protein UFOVP1530_24 [uncultured Caudovirales phage]
MANIRPEEIPKGEDPEALRQYLFGSEKPVGVFKASMNALSNRLAGAVLTKDQEALSELALALTDQRFNPNSKTSKRLAQDVVGKANEGGGYHAKNYVQFHGAPMEPGKRAPHLREWDADFGFEVAAERIKTDIKNGKIQGWDTMPQDQKLALAHEYYFRDHREVTDQHLRGMKFTENNMAEDSGRTQTAMNLARRYDEKGNPTNGIKEFFKHPVDTSLPAISGFLPDMGMMVATGGIGTEATAGIKGLSLLARAARPVVQNAITMLPFAKHEVDQGYAAPIQEIIGLMRKPRPGLPNGLPINYDEIARVYADIAEAHRLDPEKNKSAEQYYDDAVNKGILRAAGITAASVPMAAVSHWGGKAVDKIAGKVFKGYDPVYSFDPKTGFSLQPARPGTFWQPPIYPGSIATEPIPAATKWLANPATGIANLGVAGASLSTMEPTAKLFSGEADQIGLKDIENGFSMALGFAPLHLKQGITPFERYRPDQIHIPTMMEAPEGRDTLQDMYIIEGMRKMYMRDRAKAQAEKDSAMPFPPATPGASPAPSRAAMLGLENNATAFDASLPGLREWQRQRDLFLGK